MSIMLTAWPQSLHVITVLHLACLVVVYIPQAYALSRPGAGALEQRQTSGMTAPRVHRYGEALVLMLPSSLQL